MLFQCMRELCICILQLDIQLAILCKNAVALNTQVKCGLWTVAYGLDYCLWTGLWPMDWTGGVPVKAGIQEPGMEPGTVWKGSSHRFFSLSCASSLPPVPPDTHSLPCAPTDTHCLPSAPPDIHCLPPAPPDTYSFLLHLQTPICLPPALPDTACLLRLQIPHGVRIRSL